MSCSFVKADFTDEYFPFCTIEELTTPRPVLSGGAPVVPAVEHEEASETSTDMDSVGGGLPVDQETVEQDPGATIDEVVASHKENFALDGPACLRLVRNSTIMNKILALAMTATNKTLHIVGPVDPRPNANIALSLLRVNHEFYHRCRDFMFSENTIVVDKFGYGLSVISKPHGFHWCGEFCCRCVHVESLQLVLGCTRTVEGGVFKIECFMQAMKEMKSSVTVNHLMIDLNPWCFNGDHDTIPFIEMFKGKFIVKEVLEFLGLDIHGHLDLRLFPKALGMKLQPLICDFIPHNTVRQTRGFFGCSYEPATTEAEMLGLDAAGNEIEIKDAMFCYEFIQTDLYHGHLPWYFD
ncbi:MAG: hypothetical protein Q9218_006867 [Villophora microphyllina]